MKKSIQSKVAEIRTSMKMTQEELAQAVGVTRQTIIAIEKGNYTPSVALAMQIANHFNKKVEELFSLV